MEQEQDQLAQKCAAQEEITSATPSSGPGSDLTLFQANVLTAMLANFWARKGDGHPGPRVLGEGLMILAVLVYHEEVLALRAPQAPAAPKRPRKPG